MPEVFILLSLGLGLLLVIISLIQTRNDVTGAVVNDQSYTVHLDAEGTVNRLQFEFSKTKSILPTEFALRITGVYGFGLGMMAGLLLALLGVTFTMFHHMRPMGPVVWTFGWLVAVGTVWAIVFAIERHTIRKMIATGGFERQVQMGVDPLRIAGETFLRSRSFWAWSFVIAWVGVAITSPLTAAGPAIALLVLKFIEKRSARRAAAARCARPKELYQQLLPAGRYLVDGGWVTPTGMLLLMAALALAHFGRGEIAVFSACIVAFIGLVMWSEHASRTRDRLETLEDVRRVFREQLSPPAQAEEAEAAY